MEYNKQKVNSISAYILNRFFLKVLIVCSSLALQSCATGGVYPAKGVRHIQLETSKLSSYIRFGQEDILILTEAAAIQAYFGQDYAPYVLSKLDLSKEQLVVVPWTTGGPPFGTLHHRHNDANEKLIEFYVKAPWGASPRGLSIRMGLGFFATPKDSRVVLIRGEQS